MTADAWGTRERAGAKRVGTHEPMLEVKDRDGYATHHQAKRLETPFYVEKASETASAAKGVLDSSFF